MAFNDEYRPDDGLQDQGTQDLEQSYAETAQKAKGLGRKGVDTAKRHGDNYIKKKLGINSEAAKDKAAGVAKKAGKKMANAAGKAAKSAGKKIGGAVAKFASKLSAAALKLLAPFALYIIGAIVVVGVVAAAASIIIDEEYSRTNQANYQHVDYTDGNTLMKNYVNSAGNVYFNNETKRYELAKGEAPTEANKLYYVYYAIMANQSRWFVEYERTDTKPGDEGAGTKDNPYFKPIKREDAYTKYTLDGYLFNNNVIDKVGLRPVSGDKQVKLEDLIDESAAESVKKLSMNVNLLYLLNSTMNGELYGTGKSQMFFAEQFVKPVYHDEQYNFKALTEYRDMTAEEKAKYASKAHGDAEDSTLEAQFQEKYQLWSETLDAQNEARGGSNTSSSNSSSSGGATAEGISNPILKKAVEWGLNQMGKGITYSLYGARNGSDGTMDCSGFVSTALKEAGMPDVPLMSTVTMLQNSNALGQSGTLFKEVDYKTAKKGTIIVVGGLAGGGANGHTFFLMEDFHGDDTKVLECSYGYNGLSKEGTFVAASMNYNQVVALEPVATSPSSSSSSSSSSAAASGKDKKTSANLSESTDNVYKDKITTGVLNAQSRVYDTSYKPDLKNDLYTHESVNYPRYVPGDYLIEDKSAASVASDFSISKLASAIGGVKQGYDGSIAMDGNKVARYKPGVNPLGKYADEKDKLVKWAVENGYNPAWVVAVVSVLTDNGARTLDVSEYNFTNDPEVLQASEDAAASSSSGTTTEASTTAEKTLQEFMNEGRVKWQGKEYTYYSIQEFPEQAVAAPGGVPGKWFDGGYMKDKDGYLVLASDKDFGTIVDTPFGAKGKVYDRGVSGNHYDVFIDETGASSGGPATTGGDGTGTAPTTDEEPADGEDTTAASGTGTGIQNTNYGAQYYNLLKQFDTMEGGLEFMLKKLMDGNESAAWSEETAKKLGLNKQDYKAVNSLYKKVGGLGEVHVKMGDAERKVYTYEGEGLEDKNALQVISIDGKTDDTEINGRRKYYSKTEYVAFGTGSAGVLSKDHPYAIEREDGDTSKPKMTTGMWDYGFGSIFKISKMTYYAYEIGIDKEGRYFLEKDNTGNWFQQLFNGGDLAEDTQYQILGATTAFGSLDMSNEIAESQYEIEQVIEKLKNGPQVLGGDDIAILNAHKENGTSIKTKDGAKEINPGNFIVSTKPVLKEEPVLSDSNGGQYLLDYVQNYETYVPSSVKNDLDVVNRYRAMNDMNEAAQTVLNKIADIFADSIGGSGNNKSGSSGGGEYDASRFTGKTYKGTGSYKGDIPVASSGNAEQDEFLNKVSEGAMNSWVKYGVLPSVVIAQAINESGWGKSSLSVQQNNLFGVKGTGDAGTGSWATGEDNADGSSYTINANFAAYSSWSASIEAHGKLISGNTGMSNYLAAVKEKDALKSITAIKNGGYATATDYVEVTMNIINDFGLLEYDKYAIEYTDKNGFEATASGQVSNNPDTGSQSSAKADNVAGQSVWGDGTGFWDGVVDFFTSIQEVFLGLFNDGETFDPTMFSLETITNDKPLTRLKDGKVVEVFAPGSLTVNGTDAYQWDRYANKLSNENATMLLRQFVASIETRDNRPVYYDEVYDTFGNYDLSRILEEHFKQSVEGLFKKAEPPASSSTSFRPEIAGELFAGTKVAESTVTRTFGWYKDGDAVKFSPGITFKGEKDHDIKAFKSGKVVFAGDTEYGKTVIIRTNGGTEQIAYAGLGQINVKVGDAVSADTVIGKSGSSGEVTIMGIRSNEDLSKGLPAAPTTAEEVDKLGYFDMSSQFGVTGDKLKELQVKVNGYDMNSGTGKPSASAIKSGGSAKLGDFIATSGELIMPLKLEANQKATVTSPFGPRSFDGFHYGTDFVTGSDATRIIAAADGEVIISDNTTDTLGYAEMVVIKHSDNLYTSYAHMKAGSRTVKVGDRVKQGDELGTIGMTGMVTGVHLHFEVGRWGAGGMQDRVDPMTVIK